MKTIYKITRKDRQRQCSLWNQYMKEGMNSSEAAKKAWADTKTEIIRKFLSTHIVAFEFTKVSTGLSRYVEGTTDRTVRVGMQTGIKGSGRSSQKVVNLMDINKPEDKSPWISFRPETVGRIFWTQKI